MTDETPRERLSDRFLREHAAPRRRVVDEPMFAPGEPYPRTTFRVQVFTAPGVRPVVLATQEPWYEGCSLINGAERFVAAAWRRYLPQEADPPLWIQHVILESKDDGCRPVDFTVTGRYQLAQPQWGPRLSAQDLQQLLGVPVDITRGPYQRRAPAPEPQQVLAPMPVRRLPRPRRTPTGPAGRRVSPGGRSRPARSAHVTPVRRTAAGTTAGTGTRSATKAWCCWRQAHTEHIPADDIPGTSSTRPRSPGHAKALQALEAWSSTHRPGRRRRLPQRLPRSQAPARGRVRHTSWAATSARPVNIPPNLQVPSRRKAAPSQRK